MTSRIKPTIVFFGLMLLAISHAVYCYPMLPAVMALHFSFDGQPIVWMDKSTFMGVYASIVCGVSVLFLGLSLVIHKFPVWMINMPDKDYWLVPERRATSYRWLSILIMWIGNVTVVLMIVLMGPITFWGNFYHHWDPRQAIFAAVIGYVATIVLFHNGFYIDRFTRQKAHNEGRPPGKIL